MQVSRRWRAARGGVGGRSARIARRTVGRYVGRGGGRASNIEGTIQLPQVTGTQINTTVTVPDKGTILLGGQRDVTELEIEVGVPLLSKIPVVNRFFTNRIISKEEKSLLLMIRPEIIIQQEQEDALFPGLRQQMSPGAGF